MTYRAQLAGGDHDLRLLELPELLPTIDVDGATYALVVDDAGAPVLDAARRYRYRWRVPLYPPAAEDRMRRAP